MNFNFDKLMLNRIRYHLKFTDLSIVEGEEKVVKFVQSCKNSTIILLEETIDFNESKNQLKFIDMVVNISQNELLNKVKIRLNEMQNESERG